MIIRTDLAILYEKIGRYATTEDEVNKIEQIRKKEEKRTKSLYILGKIEYHRGNIEQAQQNFEKAA